MKKAAAIALLLAALPACATEVWIPYAQSETATMYFDSLRTRKMGDTSFVWDLHDLKADASDANGKHYRSVMYAIEYQCRARKRRVLGIQRYTEAMAKGAAVEETMTGEWTPTPPESLAGKLFDHICE
jgi:hypothetical protein